MVQYQGLTFKKKHWDQLAPKFSDLVASTSSSVIKIFGPCTLAESIFRQLDYTCTVTVK